MLLALHGIAPHYRRAVDPDDHVHDPATEAFSQEALSDLLRAAFRIVPFGALLAHLVSTHWAYETPFDTAFLAPLIIGGCLWMAFANIGLPSSRLLRLQMFGPMAAVFLALFAGDALYWIHEDTVIFSPLRLTLAMSCLVYLNAALLGRPALFVSLSAGSFFLALGGTPGESISLAFDLLPTSQVQLSVIAIVVAFVLLGLGAVFSLKQATESDDLITVKRAPDSPDDPLAEEPDTTSEPDTTPEPDDTAEPDVMTEPEMTIEPDARDRLETTDKIDEANDDAGQSATTDESEMPDDSDTSDEPDATDETDEPNGLDERWL
jgi:hypothetical protein